MTSGLSARLSGQLPLSNQNTFHHFSLKKKKKSADHRGRDNWPQRMRGRARGARPPLPGRLRPTCALITGADGANPAAAIPPTDAPTPVPTQVGGQGAKAGARGAGSARRPEAQGQACDRLVSGSVSEPACRGPVFQRHFTHSGCDTRCLVVGSRVSLTISTF